MLALALANELIQRLNGRLRFYNYLPLRSNLTAIKEETGGLVAEAFSQYCGLFCGARFCLS